jgi:hypothetical protein
MQNRLTEADHMLRYVIQTLSKSMETYLCRSSLFNNAVALSTFLKLDSSGLAFGNVQLEVLRSNIADRKSLLGAILGDLEALEEIAQRYAVFL